MEEMYVYLPSNSSMDVFPDNAVSRFRVKLRAPLDFSAGGSWECALVQISFPTLWNNVDEDHCRLAVNTDGKSWREMGVTPGFYSDNMTFIRTLQRELQRELVNYIGEHRIIHYDTRQRKAMFVVPNKLSIHLYEGMAQIFGYSSAQLLHGGRTYTPPGTFDVNHNTYTLWIYLDLISYSAVGSTTAPLLATVSFEHYDQDSRPEVVTKTFQTPHYVPVNKSFVDTILVDIRDHSGRLIPYILGTTVLKLHFRRRRPPYV